MKKRVILILSMAIMLLCNTACEEEDGRVTPMKWNASIKFDKKGNADDCFTVNQAKKMAD